MAAKQVTITFTPELADAIERLRIRRSEERSRLIEILLREHPYVQETIREIRSGPPLKKGRSREDLDRLVRRAEREFQKRIASGKVKLP